MPDDSDTIAQRVTVIGGDRLANAYEAISRGQPIVRIMKATERGNGETVTSIRKNTGELKQFPSLDLLRVSLAAWTA